MSYNRLVQPSCGAPNPLVAAAQQIATRPSTSGVIPVIRPPAIDFAKEFIQQQRQQQQSQHSQSLISKSLYPQQYQQVQSLQPQLDLHQHRQQRLPQSQEQSQTAVQPIQSFNASTQALHLHRQLNGNLSGGKLATEFLAEHEKPNLEQETLLNPPAQPELAHNENEVESLDQLNLNDTDKVDDVEFWQALSQAYIGPNVGTSERSDYTFDERNSLVDQYEDPFAEGVKRLEMGDIPSAALLFEAAVQKEPENVLAWQYLGTTQAQNEKDSAAIQALEKCLRLNPDDQHARLSIAVSLANQMMHNKACEHLLEWLIRHEKYASLVRASMDEFRALDNELAEDPFNMNRVDEKHYKYVRDKFVECARLAPTEPDPGVQSALGVLFNMRGDYDKAADCFKAALSVRSDDALLWNRLGATLANGNNSEQAVGAYRRALELAPGFLRSRYNLAISLIHLHTYEEAAKQLVQILNMQAAGKGSRSGSGTRAMRARSITSTSIWNTLRTVATLLNKPDYYAMIDSRDLAQCNRVILTSSVDSSSASSSNPTTTSSSSTATSTSTSSVLNQ